jgi:hypothetical protein
VLYLRNQLSGQVHQRDARDARMGGPAVLSPSR